MMLRRATGSVFRSGHRRGTFSEDIPSTSWEHRNTVSANEFLRNIAAPDDSLVPPSRSWASPTSLSNLLSPAPILGGEGDWVEPHLAQPNGLYSPSRSGADAASILPATSVERQHVTTPATELASQSRRKNKAPFLCSVEGCGSTFFRRFNLKGHLRSHVYTGPFTCEACGRTFVRMDELNRPHKSEAGVDCWHTVMMDLDGTDDGGGEASGGSSNEYMDVCDDRYQDGCTYSSDEYMYSWV
jgi:hypothetical protein